MANLPLFLWLIANHKHGRIGLPIIFVLANFFHCRPYETDEQDKNEWSNRAERRQWSNSRYKLENCGNKKVNICEPFELDQSGDCL